MRRPWARWELHPWRTIRTLAEANQRQRELIDRQATVSRELKHDNRALRDQVKRLLKPDVPEGVTGMGLDFVIVSFDRGNGLGKRVMASRDLGKTDFGMTELNDPPPRWKISSVMAGMLVIDKPYILDALAAVFEIWGSQDAAKAADEVTRPAMEKERRR